MSLIAYNKVQLDKFISPDEAEAWHKKYGKIFKIICPIAVVIRDMVSAVLVN